MSSLETQKLKKDRTILVSDYYNTPQTSTLIFHFEPHRFASSDEKMKQCSVTHACIEDKELYVFDHYFDEEQQESTRAFLEKLTYSRTTYSSLDSKQRGEKAAYSMNTKERWSLFTNPPPMIHEVHKLLSFLSSHLDVEISIAPWELSHQENSVTPSVIVNYYTEIASETMLISRHQDCKPKEGIFYGIPILYPSAAPFHECRFENGAVGKPWIVSMLLYATSKDFLPEHQMGTVFYKTNGEAALKTDCFNGRFVFFEGDLFHSAEESNIPSAQSLWRISYVLKLVLNPKLETQCVKQLFSQFLRSRVLQVHEAPVGLISRI